MVTKKELIIALEEEAKNDDREKAHQKVDDLLLGFINDVEISKAFKKVGKWYS